MKKSEVFKKVKLTHEEVSIILKILINARNERIMNEKITDDIDSIIIDNFNS